MASINCAGGHLSSWIFEAVDGFCVILGVLLPEAGTLAKLASNCFMNTIWHIILKTLACSCFVLQCYIYKKYILLHGHYILCFFLMSSIGVIHFQSLMES